MTETIEHIVLPATEALTVVAGWLIAVCGAIAFLLSIFVVGDLIDGFMDGRYRTHRRHMLDGVAIALLTWVLGIVLLRIAMALLAPM